MIKAIIFDYNGVIERDESRTLSKVREYLGASREDWSKEWYSGSREASTGRKTYQEYFLEVSSKFNDSEDSRKQVLKMLDDQKNGYRINTELVEIIKELKNKGYKIGLISNYGLELRGKIKNQGILDLFDSIIISSEVNCQKPEPEIFKLSFTELNVKPEETIFVDNAPNSLKNSEAIGFSPILYKDNESFRDELEKRLEVKLSAENKIWFKRKRYGYGWTPVTWQGWAATITWVIVFYFSIAKMDHEWIKNLIIIIAMTGILFWVCYLKGEKPRWQWGDKSKTEK